MAAIAVHIVLVAREFIEFVAGRHGREHPGKRPRLRVELRIFHRHLVRQMVRVRPRPPFDDVHGVAMRMRVVVNPAQLVLESDRVDDQRVAIPLANAVSKKRGLEILLVSAAVDGDRPKRPHQFVEKHDAIRVLNNFKRHSADAGPRYSGEQTQGFRIDRFRQVVFVRLFPGWSERRSAHALEHAAENQRPLPEIRTGPVCRPRCAEWVWRALQAL